jgi:hypothetical protein
MNRDDMIRMAREAGFADTQGVVHVAYQLESFAALVAAAEREACAKVIESDCHDDMTRAEEAAAIRARGQQ